MPSSIYLSVVIPAYNEEKRIRRTLLVVSSYLEKQDYSYEILVVNDGATDKTADIVYDSQKKIKNLKIIDNHKNHGKGYVVRQGMLYAKGRYRLFMDADNSTTINHFEKMEPYFQKGFDIVIGSRRVPGAKISTHQPWYKELLGRVGNIIIQLVGVWGYSDTQAGFKGFTAKSAEDIFKRLKNDRWAFDVEALAVAKRLKYKIKEVPIIWIDDPNSHVKLSAYIKFNFEVLKIRWNLMTDVYRTG